MAAELLVGATVLVVETAATRLLAMVTSAYKRTSASVSGRGRSTRRRRRVEGTAAERGPTGIGMAPPRTIKPAPVFVTPLEPMRTELIVALPLATLIAPLLPVRFMCRP